MTAFADALDLRTAIVEQSRDDTIVDVWPRLVSMAETKLFRKLRLRRQIVEVTLTFTDGKAAIPDDYLEVITLRASPYRVLRQTGLEHEETRRAPYSLFAMDGSNFVISEAGSDYTLTYYAKPPSIANDLTATNWLLEDHPDIYLYAVGVEAAAHQRSIDEVGIMNTLLEQAVRAAHADANRQRYGNAAVRVEGQTP